MSRLLIAPLLLCLSAAASAQSTSLAVPSETWTTPRLQARVGVNASQLGDGQSAAWQQQAGVVLGDYYFGRSRLGQGDVSSSFRATSGLLLGQRSLALGTPAMALGQSVNLTVLRQPRLAIPGIEAASEGWTAVPYLGVGWTGGSLRGGWGVSADLGFAARGAGLRGNTTQAVDELLRELRLTPVIQLGVSYAF